jgi:general secretion pathway protein A
VQELITAIRRGDGLVQVTGEKGIGKTTLCRAVSEELDRRTQISFVAEPFASVGDLLKTILVDFGVMSDKDLTDSKLSLATRVELTTALRNFLASLTFLQASAVVIVDDAQALPQDVLADIRSLADSMGRSEHLLQVVLVGDLGEHAVSRIALGPLAGDEIRGYVMHRVGVAGARARVEFNDPAFKALFRVSGGVPRTVNLVCDRAMTLAHEASVSVIDKALIEEAARLLQLARPVDWALSVQRLILPAVLVLLTLVGARAALWVFRDRVAQTLVQWTSIPPPPASPLLERFAPLDSVQAPDENTRH